MPWRNTPENFFSVVRGCPLSCARTAPWFRGQTLPVPGQGGGGGVPSCCGQRGTGLGTSLSTACPCMGLSNYARGGAPSMAKTLAA